MIETIKNFITNPQFVSLLVFFLITVVNQEVATLKSIFVANKAGMLAYLTVAIDAFLYTFLVKSLTEQTYLTVIVFILGRIIGTWIGNQLESRIAVGIYDVEIFVKDHERQKALQNKLLENGFSSTMNIGTISDNEVRWSNSVQLKRKDMNRFYEILDELGIDNPTMVVKQIKKVTGNIRDRI